MACLIRRQERRQINGLHCVVFILSMTAPKLPLPRPAAQAAEPTNIRLDPELKRAAAKVAVERYGWNLTKLTRALLRRELSVKGGLVNARLR